MSTAMRFNITLPRELGLKLKAAPNHSQLVAESLQEKFDRQAAERLQASLAEGYAARAKDDKALNQEFDHLAGEGLEG